MRQPENQAQDPDTQRMKTTAELFSERYFQQFQQVRSGGLFGPGAVPEPEPEAE